MAEISENAKSNFTPVLADRVRGITAAGVSGNILISELAALMGGGQPFEGYMVNGKISVTVVSNNLVVAIKTLAGTDPTADDKVTVIIDGVIREITSALSVTKNAATNWSNQGSAELATKEVDRFVYLGYNATDGVVIGHSRIPYACQYSDFSTTSTNEKYCAISTITNAAATDHYVNIGRFAATLSAGAGYTWSVPTFTAKNLIQRPIYETRILSWLPTVTSSGGTPTTVSKSGTYQLSGRDLKVYPSIGVTDKGTATGYMFASIPFAVTSAGGVAGRESGSTGKTLSIGINASQLDISLYDGTTIWVNGYAALGSIFAPIG